MRLLLLLAALASAASSQETGLRVASIGEEADRDRGYGSPIDRSDALGGGVSVYSNNNVNLGGDFGSSPSSSSDDPKLMGPNVCTKQEP